MQGGGRGEWTELCWNEERESKKVRCRNANGSQLIGGKSELGNGKEV